MLVSGRVHSKKILKSLRRWGLTQTFLVLLMAEIPNNHLVCKNPTNHGRSDRSLNWLATLDFRDPSTVVFFGGAVWKTRYKKWSYGTIIFRFHVKFQGLWLTNKHPWNLTLCTPETWRWSPLKLDVDHPWNLTLIPQNCPSWKEAEIPSKLSWF